ncbi:hypothetical protein SCHPADRAFT_991977 [Schizopora paradoxa]|uniref:Homeobox domain-containing protein n=1 Tax=Schizopora paradoxa TaxID=27342 RepID=A0A0H2S8T3_9AGAM|nr:hypothetical protein SCHPADRAFT_991977 [Schizopora paradoxa]
MASTSDFEEKLRQKLFKVEADFLDAAMEGTSSVSSFVESLSALTKSATYGIANRLLSDSTLALIRCVASSVNSMVDTVGEIHPRTAEIESKRQQQIDDLFARMSLKDADATPTKARPHPSPRRNKPSLQEKRVPIHKDHPSERRKITRSSSEETLVSSSSESSSSDRDGAGAHIPHAYDWLITNLHNPYPTPAVKSRIAASSGVPVRTVNDWFTNVRRRIGWTSILKADFGGDRSAIIDSACRVFVGSSQRSIVPPRILQKFLDVEGTLKRLYDGKLEASSFAKTIPDFAKETDVDFAYAKTHDGRRKRGRQENSPHDLEDTPAVKQKPRHKKRKVDDGPQALSFDLSEPLRMSKRRSSVSSSRTSQTSTSSESFDNSEECSAPATPSALTEFPDVFGDGGFLSTDILSLPSGLYPTCMPNEEHAPIVAPQECKTSRKRCMDDAEDDEFSPALKRQRGFVDSYEAPMAQGGSFDLANVSQPTLNFDQSLLGIDFSVLDGNSLDINLPNGNLEVNLFDWSNLNFPPVPAPAAIDTVEPASLQTFNNVDVQAGAGFVNQLPLQQPEETNLELNDDLLQFLQQIDATGSLLPSLNGLDSVASLPQQMSNDTPDFTSFAENFPQTNCTSLIEAPLPFLFDVDAKKERLRLLREEAEKLEKDLSSTV